jgi:hypothetical protein
MDRSKVSEARMGPGLRCVGLLKPPARLTRLGNVSSALRIQDGRGRLWSGMALRFVYEYRPSHGGGCELLGQSVLPSFALHPARIRVESSLHVAADLPVQPSPGARYPGWSSTMAKPVEDRRCRATVSWGRLFLTARALAGFQALSKPGRPPGERPSAFVAKEMSPSNPANQPSARLNPPRRTPSILTCTRRAQRPSCGR